MAMVMWMVGAYRLTHSLSRLAWFEGWRPPGASLHSSHEPAGELSQRLCHDDSTIAINIVIGIVIRPHRIHAVHRCGYCCICRTCSGLCVCLCVETRVCCAKTAEPIVSPFRRPTRVGTRSHVLDGVNIGRIHWQPRGVIRRRWGSCQITLETCYYQLVAAKFTSV